MKKKKEAPQTEEMPLKKEKKGKNKAGDTAAETKKISTAKSPGKFGGFARLLLGVLFLLAGLWLWTKTLGTQLLFTNVTIGRASRYWFIPVIVGLVLIIVGVRSVTRKPGPAPDADEPQTPATVETANNEVQASAAAETVNTDHPEDTPPLT